ncbi:MAG: Ig-like domain-containing protein [Vicinamibacterales bacterium]
MQVPTRSSVRFAVSGVLALGAISSAPGDSVSRAVELDPPIQSLAPVDVLASGFEELSAVAVEPTGTVLVTDRALGTLSRIDPSGRRFLLLDNLQGPAGVAVDEAGDVFLIEAPGRRIVRFHRDGRTSTVAITLRQPRSIAVGPDGRLWLALRKDVGDDSAGEESGSTSEYLIARLEDSGTLRTIASGFVGVQGLAVDSEALYVALARLVGERGHARTTVVRVPIRADGTAAPFEPVLAALLQRGLGIARDAAGDLFVSGTLADDDSGVVLKRPGTGSMTTLASGLRDPVALAFAPNGDLLAVEKRQPGRVLRFRAPGPPAPVVPAFTNLTPLPIDGRAEPGSRVQVFQEPAITDPLAMTLADASSGQFALLTPLAPNTGTTLSFVATAAAGSGLRSTRVAATVVHDDQRPRVTIVEPPHGAYVRDAVTVRAYGEDEGSGVASIALMLDDAVAVVFENDDPGLPFDVATTLRTSTVAEGPHALTVVATDRAANTATGAQLLVVDRTPPDTQILSGPATETSERTVTFDVGGSDAQSPVLEFAWRVDGGVWSPYGPTGTIVLQDMAAGVHRFEARTRDLAGNEDATPAVQSFTVVALRLRLVEPAADAVITTDTLWVRGSVDGTDPVVTIPLSAELRAQVPVAELTIVPVAGSFAAEVPVAPGTTALAVTARDALGSVVSQAVSVSVQLSPEPGRTELDAFPVSGFAPHTVRFGAGALPPGVYWLDLESDGTYEYVGGDLDGREFVYMSAGVHLVTLQIVTQDGQISTRRTSVTVYERLILETQLRGVWEGFREALRSGEVDRVVESIHTGRRVNWEAYLRQFTPELFEATSSVFTDITLVELMPGRAEGEMMREVDGLLYSFPVSFSIDADGRWRLWQF